MTFMLILCVVNVRNECEINNIRLKVNLYYSHPDFNESKRMAGLEIQFRNF